LIKKWIVKDVLDHIHGPYETEEIFALIENGTFTGEEHISAYPGGKWIQISTEPEFFDYMLSALAGNLSIENTKANDSSPDEGKEDNDNSYTETDSTLNTIPLSTDEIDALIEKNNEPSEIEHTGESFSDSSVGENSEEKNKNKINSSKNVKVYREVKGRSHLFEDRQVLGLDEQAELRKNVKKKKRADKALLLVFALAVCLILSYFLIDDETDVALDSNSYQLELPEKSITNFAVTDAKTKEKALVNSIKLLTYDEPEKTILAVDYLNSVLKFEPRNSQALLLLCNSIFQIWPFTNQQSSDFYVISELSKRAFSSGLEGDALSTCRVIEKILYDKTEDASKIVDSYLNAEDATGSLSFYLRYYKSYILFKDRDLDNSQSFSESSIDIESRWIPSLLLLGKIYIELNQSQNASNVFSRILTINPKHFEAMAYLSFLQFEYFGKPVAGLKIFKRLESIKDKRQYYDKRIYSLVLSAIAKAYLKTNKVAKAGSYAQRAFDEDTSNVQAKNILITTGSKTELAKADRLFMAEANQLFKEKEWKTAIAIYEQAYNLNNKNGLAALRISQSYWKQSFIKESIKWAERAIIADPKEIQPYVTLSEYLINQYELIDAERVLLKSLRVSNKSYKVYGLLAKVEYLKKNYPKAVAYVRRALKMYSNDSDSIITLSKTLEATGEIEKAYANAKAAIEITDPSFELENYFCLLLMKNKGLNDALEYISKKETESGGSLKYETIKANLYREDEQFNVALKIAKESYEALEGGSIDVVMSYARALAKVSKVDASLDKYQQAFLMRPTNPSPLFESAQLLLEKSQPGKSIIQLERVEQVSPKFPELSYYWAKALKMLGKSKADPEVLLEAIQYANKEIERNPNHVESFLLKAEINYSLGSLTLNKAQTMSSSDPDYSETYSQMISYYKLCSSAYQKSIDLALQPAHAYISLARCQRLSGQIDLAVVSAKKAEKTNSANSMVWIEMALIYEQQGNIGASVKAYEKYLLIFPNAPNKDDVSKKLRELKEQIGAEE